MEIKININEDCAECKKGLKYFKSLNKRHKDIYANMNMKTYKFIEGISLSPVFNSEGYLTHFHISKLNKKFAREIFEALEKNERNSKKITKLKKGGKWNNKK